MPTCRAWFISSSSSSSSSSFSWDPQLKSGQNEAETVEREKEGKRAFKAFDSLSYVAYIWTQKASFQVNSAEMLFPVSLLHSWFEF